MIMFAYVNRLGWASCLYFVTWVVLGNFVLLSLFLAVIMEAFESKYDMQVRTCALQRALTRQPAQTCVSASKVAITNPRAFADGEGAQVGCEEEARRAQAGAVAPGLGFEAPVGRARAHQQRGRVGRVAAERFG